ncbi:MAG: MYG1 family protein [Candidatus Zambryskibacteria bacterium]|nr:MYG1 family protein [Candidatus Zambryskibacteria bacterium]
MPKTIVTHSGSFHTDDVFAVAALLLKYPDAIVVRSRDTEVINKADIVVDVGLVYDPESKRFDHHQHGGAGVRGNGIPYASFGLVWKALGEDLAGQESAALIEEKLVMPIDAPDNGVSTYEQIFEDVRPYTIVDFIYSYFFNGYIKNKEQMYETFMTVVGVAKDLLKREISKSRERVGGMKTVREILETVSDKRIVVLESDLPWEPVLVPIPEATYVIYPRREGNWGVKGVPSTIKGFERKKLLPLEWSGLEGKELRAISGVSDSMFCHRNRFIAAAESKEGAVKLAELALNA